MKFYKVRGCDGLSEWDFDKIKRELPDIDWFIYNYHDYGYDGTGIAIWQQGSKYGYSYLGHCSCNGPLDDLNHALFTWDEITKLVQVSKNWEWVEHGQQVFEKAKRLREKK